MLGQLGHVLVGLADNLMVGQLGAAPLAAVSLANSIIFIALSLGIGFTFAITPLVAEADGEISKPEIQFIEGCAKYFGLQRNQYESIQSLWLDKQVNPYKILGVEKEATNEEIRKKWIQLSKELHPDQLRAQGVPQELIIKSEDRLSEINQAYDKIKSLRKIN